MGTADLRRAARCFFTFVIGVSLGCGGHEPPAPGLLPVLTQLPQSSFAPNLAPLGEPVVGKLPEDVTPIRYRLSLEVSPDRERFSGVTEIDVELREPTQRVILHALSLNVTAAELRAPDGRSMRVVFRAYGETGVVAVDFPVQVSAGRYTLVFAYDAPFDRQLKGMYRVRAGGADYAFTQFEPIAARLAFPCFDEPRFKTPFDVTLIVRESDQAIANTQQVRAESVPGGLRRIQFATTEPLPTYLIAFAVGPLDVVDAVPLPPNAVRSHPVPFRGVAVRGKGAELAYALSQTPAMVAELEAYFGTPYPYDKLDIIAVPDFAAGAMENAGAITFRETLLLLDQQNVSEGQRRAFFYVMAHELAHQWFGNLVTMPWWDDIWLNEAFATWMGHRVVGQLHPEQHAQQALLQSVHRAMDQDSLINARTIRQPIETSHDILNAFDAITYQKGGGVLAMFERFVGPEVFRAGIRAYLAQHRFGTATATDLISAITQAHGAPLDKAFSSFLDQPGVPLVRTELSCAAGRSTLRIEQLRSLPLGSTGNRDQTWEVPLCVRWGVGNRDQVTCTTVRERQVSLELPSTGCPEWYIPNQDASGYLRFAMKPADLTRLRTRGWQRLTGLEQQAVADSLSAAFAAGEVSVTELFAMATVLTRSQHRAVITAPMAWFEFARDHVVSIEQRQRVEQSAAALYRPLQQRLGWQSQPSDDGEERLLRAEIQRFMALTARDTDARREAERLGRAYLGLDQDGALHPDAVPQDLVATVLAVLVQQGDTAVFNNLADRLAHSDDAVFRERLLYALGSTEQVTLAERALQLALDPTVRVNEALVTVTRQLGEPTRRDAVWTWLEANMIQLLSRVGSARGGRLPWLATAFCSQDAAASAQALFQPLVERLAGGPRNLTAALEAVSLCDAKVKHHRAAITGYFASPTRSR